MPAAQLLFVDDDAAILRIAQRYFEPLGFAADTASTAEDATALLRRQPIGCAAREVLLPGADGFARCKASRAWCTRTAFSSQGSPSARKLQQDFFSTGGDDFATKPFDLKEPEMRVRARIG